MNLSEDHWVLISAGVIGLFALLIMPFSCESKDPNLELAMATREVVQLARDSRETSVGVMLGSGRFRILALSIAVSSALGICYLIYRSMTRPEAADTEIIERLEESGMLRPPEDAVASLTTAQAQTEDEYIFQEVMENDDEDGEGEEEYLPFY